MTDLAIHIQSLGVVYSKSSLPMIFNTLHSVENGQILISIIHVLDTQGIYKEEMQAVL